ncbi:hypothetical protein L3V82_10295 [Thiotrichales bacterium 19S3-7]|nr:hypothetical protein [Thiotrichales bacterium 19S3-7]MCF6802546.1 hypothetical protein [Thiotrichales bacterium 19S3-11]
MNLDVKVKELAEILMVSPRRIQQLTQEKVIEKSERGKYPLVKNIQNYICYITLGSKDLEKNYSHDDLNILIKKEKVRLLKAQADKEEIDAELAKKKTLLADDVFDVLVGVFSEIKNKLLAVSDRCEPYLVGETDSTKIKQIIRIEIKDALYSITDGMKDTLDRLVDDEEATETKA